MSSNSNQAYDAILIVSFGGPEGMPDVMPFLENVLRGRNVPRARMHEVAQHYERFGGVSPINEQVRQMIAALRAELQKSGPQLPLYWGNRNWHPMLADTLHKMAEDGVTKALAFVTSAYSSYSGCRQYLDNLETAKKESGQSQITIEKIRPFYNHPLFIEANAARLKDALDEFSAAERKEVLVAFTAHSIPESMAKNCRYQSQLEETARLVADAAGASQWHLCFQSRSGPAEQPWLSPDISDYINEAYENGVRSLAIAPIGFLSDHMEVIFDLDTAAREVCDRLGVKMVRAATVGTHPQFIAMIRELILERLNSSLPHRAVGVYDAWPDQCAPDCCPSGGGRPVRSESATQ